MKRILSCLKIDFSSILVLLGWIIAITLAWGGINATLKEHDSRIQYLEEERKRDNADTAIITQKLVKIETDCDWIRKALEQHIQKTTGSCSYGNLISDNQK